MITSKRAWDRYIAALRKVNDEATESILYYLQQFGIPSTPDEMDALIDAAFAISNKYGEAAAALAAEWYDATAALAGRILDPAVPAPTAPIDEVARAIVGTAKTQNEEIIAASIGRLVKRTGVDTTMQNAIRDDAEWAWIPVGDTCAFCITLASRGWQPASAKALKGGHAEHIHANCDCTYQIRFDGSSSVAGYDPDKYLEMYEDAEGKSSKDKINAMRRELYAENREKILEQKADAYEKRKELESSAMEEADV